MAVHIITDFDAHKCSEIEKRAEAAGYELVHVAGYILIDKYGTEGGHRLVVKDGKVLARFSDWRERARWLEREMVDSVGGEDDY